MLFRPVSCALLVALLVSACKDEHPVPTPQAAAGDAGDAGDSGTPSQPDASTEVPREILTGAMSLVATGLFSCALLHDGRVVCWGLHVDGVSATPEEPFFMPGFEGVKTLYMGGDHLVGVFADGSVKFVGSNFQLNPTESQTERRTLRPIPQLPTDTTQLAISGSFGCALTSGGEVFCWGRGWEGQLGNGERVHDASPPVRAHVSDVRSIATSTMENSDTCAVRNDGTVYCWGRITSHGSTSLEPVRISGITDALEVVVAREHACALRRGGRVSCWGWAGTMRLLEGLEGIQTNTEAGEIPGLENVQSLSNGGFTTCATLMNGEVRCWGLNGTRYNPDGGGDDIKFVEEAGTFLARPMPLPGVPPSTFVSLGSSHGCALTRAGTVSCWGKLSMAGNPPAVRRDYPHGVTYCLDSPYCYKPGKTYDVLAP